MSVDLFKSFEIMSVTFQSTKDLQSLFLVIAIEENLNMELKAEVKFLFKEWFVKISGQATVTGREYVLKDHFQRKNPQGLIYYII